MRPRSLDTATSATATVSAGQKGFNLVNTGIFLNMETLGHNVKHGSAHNSDNPKYNNGSYNNIHGKKL